MNVDEIRGRATISVVEAGMVLGIGRDAAYAAAGRGEIPTLRLGRRLRVPVGRLLDLLGHPAVPADTPGSSSGPAVSSEMDPAA